MSHEILERCVDSPRRRVDEPLVLFRWDHLLHVEHIGLVALGRLVGNQEFILFLIKPTKGDDPLIFGCPGDVTDDASLFGLLCLDGIGGVPRSAIITGDITTPIGDRR
jgi:hypothetical protein